MLSSADATLVARDPAIPGLALLLDPEAFAAALRAALPQAKLGPAEPHYVRYKPGTNCLVAYQVNLPVGPTRIYARAYAAELSDKLANVQPLHDQPGALGVGGLALAEPRIAVYSWPHDRELPALTHLGKRRRRARLLTELCPTREDLSEAALIHLRYRPERRYVARLVGGAQGDALLKLYCTRDYEPARAAAASFRSSGPLEVVRPLGCSDAARALLFPWRPGASLASLLADEARAPAALRLTGAALAALHAQSGAGLPQTRRDTPLVDLAAAAATITTICPELSPRVRWLTAQLARYLQAQPMRLRPLHGDFYADQVLVGANYATLLDLDNARWGEPAADLGAFVAHLWRAAALGHETSAKAVLLAEALYAGYAELATLPSQAQIRRYSALSLLRLAPEPFRYRALNWPDQVAGLVAAAVAILTDDHGQPLLPLRQPQLNGGIYA